MNITIAVLPGDSIGPEIMAVALPVLEVLLQKSGHTLYYSTTMSTGPAPAGMARSYPTPPPRPAVR